MTEGHDRGWLGGLLGPDEPELGCDACFAALDQYVERELHADDADQTFPGMKAHLQGCGACREEHDLLLAMLREQ